MRSNSALLDYMGMRQVLGLSAPLCIRTKLTIAVQKIGIIKKDEDDAPCKGRWSHSQHRCAQCRSLELLGRRPAGDGSRLISVERPEKSSVFRSRARVIEGQQGIRFFSVISHTAQVYQCKAHLYRPGPLNISPRTADN